MIHSVKRKEEFLAYFCQVLFDTWGAWLLKLMILYSDYVLVYILFHLMPQAAFSGDLQPDNLQHCSPHFQLRNGSQMNFIWAIGNSEGPGSSPEVWENSIWRYTSSTMNLHCHVKHLECHIGSSNLPMLCNNKALNMPFIELIVPWAHKFSFFRICIQSTTHLGHCNGSPGFLVSKPIELVCCFQN